MSLGPKSTVSVIVFNLKKIKNKVRG